MPCHAILYVFWLPCHSILYYHVTTTTKLVYRHNVDNHLWRTISLMSNTAQCIPYHLSSVNYHTYYTVSNTRYTHAHIRMHSRTPTCIHTSAHACRRSGIHTCVRASSTCTHAYSYAFIHLHACASACVQARLHGRTHARIPTRACAHAWARVPPGQVWRRAGCRLRCAAPSAFGRQKWTSASRAQSRQWESVTESPRSIKVGNSTFVRSVRATSRHIVSHRITSHHITPPRISSHTTLHHNVLYIILYRII